MKKIESIEELERLYETVVPGALDKVRSHLSPRYREWIEASPFLVLSTVGPAGTDASPRGDDGAVVRIVDDHTILLPDWRGNNRLDSLRNVVEDGRVSLMFMVPGSNNVVRVNGTAVITTDIELTSQFAQRGKHPRSVIVVHVGEVYYQCAKALMRSRLWQPREEDAQVPTAGQFIKELKSDFDADSYDAGYAANAEDRMW